MSAGQLTSKCFTQYWVTKVQVEPNHYDRRFTCKAKLDAQRESVKCRKVKHGSKRVLKKEDHQLFSLVKFQLKFHRLEGNMTFQGLYWTIKQWRKNLGDPCYRNVKLSHKYPKENWNGKSKLKKLSKILY